MSTKQGQADLSKPPLRQGAPLSTPITMADETRYFLQERELLGDLARVAYDTVRQMMSAGVERPGARPGMVAVIQTFASTLK